MLCFSTVLLLAAACLFVSADVRTETVTSCGNSVHRLSCDTGVISIETVLYRHADSVTCSERKPPQENYNTDCFLAYTGDALKRRCNGKKVCELNANVFGGLNPCRDTFKYLQTKYSCLPAIHQVTCEHSLAHLQCDEGQVIFIHSAHYGRHDQTTCSYKRPTSQTQNTDCSHPAGSVSDSCNGKNSCIIKVSNSVFGDPCVGTYKYLEVAHICKYPVYFPADFSH